MVQNKLSVLLGAILGCAACFAAPHALAQDAKAQDAKPAALRVSIAETGAVADGKTTNTQAIQKAIDQVAAGGGGTVVVPEGTFLSGSVFLKPGVNLHLDKGGVLKGTTNIKDYPEMETRIEGHFQQWIPALVNADKNDGLKIDGEGTLDGSGQPYWNAFRTAMRADRTTKNLDVPRPRLVFIRDSKNVTVSGIHFKDSGFWNLHVYRCQEVTIENLDIRAGANSPSCDGMDIDSSQNVTIRGCYIFTNDDCIALKGTKGPDAMEDKDSPPVEHIRVSDCTFAAGNGFVTCGSEASIIRDVVVENCRTAEPHRVACVLRLKIRTDTPQHYSDMHFNNITLGGSTGALIAVAPWTQYFDLKGKPQPTRSADNISISNVKGSFGSFGSVAGGPGDTFENFTFENIDLTVPENARPPRLSAIKDLKLTNVKINGAPYTGQ